MEKLGTEQAERIIREYSDMVYRIALHNLRNPQDAEDVLQDVFLGMLKKPPQIESEEHLKAWLIRAAIHRSTSLFRQFWRRKSESLEDHADLEAPHPQQVMEEILKLPKDSRNILYLYYYESYTIAEIAQILGKNQNTVSSSLQRARRKLKAILLEGEETDER